MKINIDPQSLTKLADQSRSLRTRLEAEWYLNLAFYLGDQWVYWNNGRLDRPQVAKNVMLEVDNRIMPVIQTRVAKKLKQRPIWQVTPNSESPEDIDAAHLGELVMEDQWKGLAMAAKLSEVVHWSDICSAGFWKVSWDSTVGDSIEVVMSADGSGPQRDQSGLIMKASPEIKGIISPERIKRIAQGDVRIDVRSPFQILPDPLAKSMDECEWMIEEVVQSPEYIRAHFKKDMEGDTEASTGPVDGRYFNSKQTGGSSSYRGIKTYEFWCKPNEQFPKGKRVVWAKEQILADEDNPYGCLPYIMFPGVPVPGRFWPTSIVTQLRGPQVTLNKLKSQIRMNAQRIGNPSVLIPRTSDVEMEGIPGEEIRYSDVTPNAAPQYLQPPSMPPYVLNEVESIENSIREISGQHEVTSSQVPAGVTAASAINLLLEQDDTRLGPAIQDMEEALASAGSHLLKLVAKYYTDQRMLRISGDDGDWDFITFRGEALRNNTAVEVQAGSAFPVSKAAKQAAMTQIITLFVQNGIPLDPRALRKFFKDYQVGGLDQLFGDMTEDLVQIKRENRLMSQGNPLPINSFDDDEAHIAEHGDFMKSYRYSRMVAQDQRIAQIFEQHLAAHRQRMDKNQQAQQQAQVQPQLQLQDHQGQIDMQHLQIEEGFQQRNADREAAIKLAQIRAQQQRQRS